jgi:transcriptional regulator with GAF, ATPase, and Fis domain
MDGSTVSLAACLAAAARQIDSPRTVAETLDAIVHAALQSVPGVDEVGVTISHRDGTLETAAGTSPLVRQLDQLQYELDEGPGLQAIRDGVVVTCEDVTCDPRWPRFGIKAAELGLRAQVGVQLWAERSALGGLNLYSLQPDSIDHESVIAAELFATHAAIALGRARTIEQLHEGLESRSTIGAAIGIIMERHQVDVERAFQFLTRVSSTSSTRIRVVAQQVIDEAARGMTPRVTPTKIRLPARRWEA